MKLILVRHGHTDALEKGIVQGHRFGKLNTLGREQAKQVAKHLRHINIDRVYSSDLERVTETAKEILHYHPDVEVIYDQRLREKSSGDYEGLPNEEYQRHLENSGQHVHDFRAPHGESWQDLYERVEDWYNDLRSQQLPHTVVVSHGGVIRSLLTLIFHGESTFHPEYSHHNTGVSIIDYTNPQQPAIEVLNDTSHLENISVTS